MHPTAQPLAPSSAQSPEQITSQAAEAVCRTHSPPLVGPSLQTDDEREAFIWKSGEEMQAAYARFEQFHLPSDRDAALQWMHLRDQAIAGRSKARTAALEAEINRRIVDEGCGYFCGPHALALGRAGVRQ